MFEARRRAARRHLLQRAAAVGLPLALALGYGAVRVKVQRDVAQAVAGQVTQAEGAMAAARGHTARAAAVRARALALFDAAIGEGGGAGPGTWQEAERLWATSREQEERAEAAYVHASQILESAVTLEQGRGAARALLAEVTLERILLAERRPGPARPGELAELAERLALHDRDGSRRRRLDAPARLRVRASPTPAAVEVRRYETGDDVFLPREVAAYPAPSRGQELALELPAGSYLLVLRAPGHPPLRLPVLLRRGEEAPVHVSLPARVPPGYVYVPPGRFLFGADGDDDLRRGFLDAPPLHEQRTGGYLIGETEVTFAQWLEFLRELPAPERARRLPRGTDLFGGLALLPQPDGRMRFTLQLGAHVYQALEGEPVRYGARDRRASQDWLRFPVSAISWEDAQAYLAWLRRSGRLPGARLCSEMEWERAARGADGRTFPHGNRLAPDDANHDETYGRAPLGYGPDEVGAHPASASPFGVQDMTGNAWEFVSSSRRGGEVVLRGGSWYQGSLTARIPNRNVSEPTMRNVLLGLRVCASPET